MRSVVSTIFLVVVVASALGGGAHAEIRELLGYDRPLTANEMTHVEFLQKHAEPTTTRPISVISKWART